MSHIDLPRRLPPLGGLGLLLAPALALRLLLSTGGYGDIMPRVVGMFRLALGGVILQFVRARDYPHTLASETIPEAVGRRSPTCAEIESIHRLRSCRSRTLRYTQARKEFSTQPLGFW